MVRSTTYHSLIPPDKRTRQSQLAPCLTFLHSTTAASAFSRPDKRTRQGPDVLARTSYWPSPTGVFCSAILLWRYFYKPTFHLCFCRSRSTPFSCVVPCLQREEAHLLISSLDFIHNQHHWRTFGSCSHLLFSAWAGGSCFFNTYSAVTAGDCCIVIVSVGATSHQQCARVRVRVSGE